MNNQSYGGPVMANPSTQWSWRGSSWALLAYVVFLGLMLGFLCRPDVADMYYTRFMSGPVAVLLYQSKYLVFFSAMLMAGFVLLDKLRGASFDFPSLALLLFLCFRAILFIRRVSVGYPMVEEFAAFALVTVLVLVFSQKLNGVDVDRSGFLWISVFMLVEMLGYLALNGYQDIVDPTSVENRGRFHGLNSHSNEFSMSLGLISVWLYLALFWGRFWIKILSAAALTAAVYFVYRSGSRSGALTFIVAGLLYGYWLLRSRPMWLILGGLFAALVLPLGWYYVEAGVESVAESRLISTQNTRAEVFKMMWNNFLDNPVLGNPATAGGTSNSYLYAASSVGVLGGGFLMAFLWLVFRDTWAIGRNTRWRGMDISMGLLGPWAWSAFAGIMVSSAFSGYFVETMQFPLLFTLFHVALLNKVRAGVIVRYGIEGGRRMDRLHGRIKPLSVR
jgi:hypothetical protein